MTDSPYAAEGDRGFPPLELDLYELTMGQVYLDAGIEAEATFSLFARHLPPGWGFFLAAGLDDVLTFLERFAFAPRDLAYLESTGLFSRAYLEHLSALRFRGAVRALPEGTACFPQEPLVEVTAPIVEAQLVETALVNLVHFQTIIASKAARCVRAARGRLLVDFSLRRTHLADAGLAVARSAYLAGFDSTSNVLAGARYDIPIAGTMAHSLVQAFGDEVTAFRAFAGSYADSSVFLVDTYDTPEGTRRAAGVAQELAAQGHRLRGVRLDSGDLAALSVEARRILDAAGHADATIFASGSLDEHAIAALLAGGAPIDGFGVGSRLGVSADAPYLDMAYKLVAYGGRPTLKLSAGKATLPGPKQVWRCLQDGLLREDTLATFTELGPREAMPLLLEVMRDGRRLAAEPLAVGRERARREVGTLPPALHELQSAASPPVRISPALARLRDDTIRRVGRPAGTPTR